MSPKTKPSGNRNGKRPEKQTSNRIDRCFARLRDRGKKALIVFVTAGDPSLKHTPEIVWALEEAGADMVELGVPFSDPIADGPVIQRSSERALQQGASVGRIIETVQVIREKSEIPLILMGYANPFFQYGMSPFTQDLAHAGGDGCLVVDLPPAESESFNQQMNQKGLKQIFLLSPTSTDERIRMVQDLGSGFIYFVSLAGVTGTKLTDTDRVARQVQHIRGFGSLPIAVGFGIRDVDQIKNLRSVADGVVVGSAIVQNFEACSFTQGLNAAKKLVSQMTQALA